MSNFTQIRTYARVKPLPPSELSSNVQDTLAAVVCTGPTSLLFNPSSLRVVAPKTRFSTARGRALYDQLYEFDGVLAPGCSEEEVYLNIAQPLLRSALQGKSTSIFAYGATGCGKSYTINSIQNQLSHDIVARVAESPHCITLKLSYLQLYNEKIIDLLPTTHTSSPPNTAIPSSKLAAHRYLEIRDAGIGAARVMGLTEYTVTSAQQITELFERGSQNRIIAATQANLASSRSHAVLTFTFENKTTHTTSTLSVIDLAGNERAQATNNRGQRLNEGAQINRSLLALGNCITARALKKPFIPYRESKLTRLLRSSLQGDCETAMVVCLSPSLRYFDESKNSLEYGKRAASICRVIQSRSRHNSTSRVARITQLEQELQELKHWRQQAFEMACSQPNGNDLRATVGSLGGVERVSGPDFVTLCMQTLTIDNDMGLKEVEVFNPDTMPESPLKRDRRSVSAASSRGSLSEPVKRHHR